MGPNSTRGPAPLLQPETQGEGLRLPPGLCAFSLLRAGQWVNLGRTHLGWALGDCLAKLMGGSEGVQGIWFRPGRAAVWGLEGRREAGLLLLTRTWVGYDAQATLRAEDSSPALKTDVLLNSSHYCGCCLWDLFHPGPGPRLACIVSKRKAGSSEIKTGFGV